MFADPIGKKWYLSVVITVFLLLWVFIHLRAILYHLFRTECSWMQQPATATAGDVQIWFPGRALPSYWVWRAETCTLFQAHPYTQQTGQTNFQSSRGCSWPQSFNLAGVLTRLCDPNFKAMVIFRSLVSMTTAFASASEQALHLM